VPSVRGPERIVVASLLMLASAASGALAGFVAGLGGEAISVDRDGMAVVVTGAVIAAVVLDRFVAPLSVRRQVPQLWGRIFSAQTTAVLYGARLGVGPLTILRTWWWWVAVVLGALAGVWVSVAVGAVFGAARIAVMLAAGTRAYALSRGERFARWSGVAVGVALVVFVAFVAALDDRGVAERAAARRWSAASRAGRSPSGESGADAATTTTPDVVTPTSIAADAALAAMLPADVGAGYERVPDDVDKALGPLDLATAAAIEQDTHAERALLETRQFEVGHARGWRHDDGRTAYVAAYRFGSAADADAYLVDGFITLEGRGARVYPVTEVPGARGFSQAATQGETSEVAHGVAFVRGDVFFLAVIGATSSAADANDAVALAQQVDAVVPG